MTTSTCTFTVRILRTFSLILATATLLATLAATASAQNPVPFVDQPLVPDATAPGGPAFTLTVNGAGFVSGSVVNWNGSPRATTFISSSQLTAKILASEITVASTISVTVVNPSPGGGISNTSYFSIVLPEASVSFVPAVTYVTEGQYPISEAVADLNGDGKPDVVVTNISGTVSVFLGNGDGTFQPAVSYDASSPGPQVGPSSIAIADVNGDGKADLIVTTWFGCFPSGCTGNGSVDVLLGNGDGTFQPAVDYDSGGFDADSVAVADLNGDGKLDLVVGNWCGGSGTCSAAVTVLLGNGDGTFQSAVPYGSVVGGVLSVAIADLSGDGKLDVLAAYYGPCCGPTGITGVLTGKGDGTFQPGASYAGVGGGSVTVGDVNGDGKPDLIVTYPCEDTSFCNNSTVGVMLGNGDGTFQPQVAYNSGGYQAASVAIADIDGDGKPDLLVANGCGYFNSISSPCASGTVALLRGNGDGTFQPATIYGSGGFYALSIAPADLNGGGRLDALVTNACADTSCGQGSVGVLLYNTTKSGSPTTAALMSSLNPSGYGQPVTFTATVSSASGTPNGTVVLYDGSIAIGSGTLTNGRTSILISSLSAGSDSLTAAYQGSATFASSISSVLIQTVSPATTSTGLTPSPNPARASQSVTFTATVTSQYGGAATGSVTFLSGSQTLGTATLSGNRAILTTSFATAGTYSTAAKYSGDNNNTGSTSSTLSQVITVATTTTLVSSLNPSLIAQAVTFTATVSSTAGAPPNGEIVTFYNASAVLGTAPLSVGVASLTTSSLLAGIYTITAAYDGDSTFAASTSPGLRQVVNSTTKSGTATTLISSLNPSIYGQKVVWTATVTTSGPVPPTGKVNFSWNGNSIGTASLNATGVATLTRSALNADTYPLTAVYQGDTNNLASRSPVLIQVVTETTSSAALTSSPNPSTAGEAVTFTATIKSPTIAATGPVTFSAGKTVLGTAQLANGKATFTISTLPVGTTTVTANYYGDSNISGSSASATESVQP
ncbi:MAG: Ig-like domain repeat protein [Candidatus Sulfotelmatobacter sp.]